MERKIFHSIATKADGDQGIVESIVAVFGNVDDGGDVIHPGAFRKTINERGGKVKVLDHHRTDSAMAVIGKPLAMKELDRTDLPQELLQQYPDATGGLWTRTQFLMNTPEGKGVFERIKSGALDEWSIGYDALDTDYSNVTKDGKEIAVRNLRTMKLYEYSPVVFAMNPAASTLSAKEKEGDDKDEDAEPSEGKPWGVVEEDGKFCVYKLDEDGKPTGERLGEHESRAQANRQLRALYANEDKDEKDEPAKEAEPLQAEKSGRRMRRDKAELLNKLTDILGELRKWAEYDDDEDEDEEEMAAPERAASEQEHEQKQAGPVSTPPTSETLLKIIEIEQEQINLVLED